MTLALAIIVAYLVGSIPFGLLLARLVRGVDIRKHGSGNIGATNVYRVLGPAYGVLCLVLDAAKGLAPVLLAKWLLPDMPVAHALAAAATVVGHSASVFLHFKGGKGAATSLGVLYALDWRLASLSFATWILLVVVTRYVSVASIVAVILAVIYSVLLHQPAAYMVLFAIMACLVVARHTANIGRLLQGEEPRLWPKTPPQEQPK